MVIEKLRKDPDRYGHRVLVGVSNQQHHIPYLREGGDGDVSAIQRD